MWVKTTGAHHRTRFLKLDDMCLIWADDLPVPRMMKDEETHEWYEDMFQTPGIFFNAPDGPICLVEFNSVKEAEESLCNLFRAWSAYRASIYIMPQGTNWVIEAIGREEERKRR